MTGIVARLSESRWLIAAVGILLLVLAVAGLVAPLPAVVIFVALLVFVAVLPRARAAQRVPQQPPGRAQRLGGGVQAFANAFPTPASSSTGAASSATPMSAPSRLSPSAPASR